MRGRTMRRRRSFLPASLLLLTGVASPAQPQSQMAALLEARAEAPVEARAAEPRMARGTQTERLFFMTGADNASCVRSVADVTGDGRDDIVAGIDESGTDNVFLLDGASSGPATVVWTIETMDGVSGGSPWGDQSLTPISDTDGNGSQNLLLGTAWGGRAAYDLDSLDGAIQWRYDTYDATDSGWVYSLAQLDDITGDGVPEAAFGAGSDNDKVYMVDGASSGPATVIWEYQAADAVLSVCDLGDADGDGDHDVLAAIGDSGQQLVALSGGTASPSGQVLWTYPAGDTANACGVMPDVTGDGVQEALAVLWTTGGSAVRCLNGATGALVWSSTEVGDPGMMVDLLEDVTGDGTPEIVVGSWENAVIVLDGGDGSLVWKTVVGTLNGGDVWTARAIDDLSGDGSQDVIAGSFDYHVYALDGDDGAVLWTFDTNNRVFSVYPAGDLDGDGRPEVVAGTQDTNDNVVVHVLAGGSGAIFSDGFESGDTLSWSATVPGF